MAATNSQPQPTPQRRGPPPDDHSHSTTPPHLVDRFPVEPHFRRSTGPFPHYYSGPHEHNSPEPPVQPPQHPQSGSQTCQTLQSGPRIRPQYQLFSPAGHIPENPPDWRLGNAVVTTVTMSKPAACPPTPQTKTALGCAPAMPRAAFLPVDAPHPPPPTPPCRRHLFRRHPSRLLALRYPVATARRVSQPRPTTPGPSSAAASSPRPSKAIAGLSRWYFSTPSATGVSASSSPGEGNPACTATSPKSAHAMPHRR